MNKNARPGPRGLPGPAALAFRAFFLCGNTRKKEVFSMQNLFVHSLPACRRRPARWRTASMAGAAMLAALAVVLDRFTWQVGPMLEIGISFLAVGVSGFLYGPGWPGWQVLSLIFLVFFAPQWRFLFSALC